MIAVVHGRVRENNGGGLFGSYSLGRRAVIGQAAPGKAKCPMGLTTGHLVLATSY
jgi:hypothetical protein